MSVCKPGDIPITKEKKFSLNKYPKNKLKEKKLLKIPCTLGIESLMYAYVWI